MQKLWKFFTELITKYYDPGPGVSVDFYMIPLLIPVPNFDEYGLSYIESPNEVDII